MQFQPDESRAQPPVVVLVDDEADIVQALQALLTFKGVRTAEHASAESLLDAVFLHEGRLWVGLADGGSAPVQAAVLDLHLPGINGIELAQRLRAMQADVQLVIMTAAQGEWLQRHAQALPGVVLLPKPFTLEALESALFGP